MTITIDSLLFCPLSRTQLVEKARADAEKIKLIGAAEATAIENVGRSEAEAMRLKAAAYKLYGEAATLSLVFEALPKIAAEVAAPLAKTEEIVMLSGGGSLTAGINQLVSQVPPAVHALTGVDLSQVIKKYLSIYNSQQFFADIPFFDFSSIEIGPPPNPRRQVRSS